MTFIFFQIFASMALISGLIVITSKNPVSSVLFLVLVFCNASALLILLEVEFMALIFLVVYVGAIAVLFLFVVMMLSPKMEGARDFNLLTLRTEIFRQLPIGILLGMVFLGVLFFVVKENSIGLISRTALNQSEGFQSWINIMDGVGSSTSNLESLGQILYTQQFYYFLVAGFVLLVAMIGAIVLTLPTKTFEVIDFKKLMFGLTPISVQDFSLGVFTPREVRNFFILLGKEETINSKRQQVFEQLSRSPQNAVFLTNRDLNILPGIPLDLNIKRIFRQKVQVFLSKVVNLSFATFYSGICLSSLYSSGKLKTRRGKGRFFKLSYLFIPRGIIF